MALRTTERAAVLTRIRSRPVPAYPPRVTRGGRPLSHRAGAASPGSTGFCSTSLGIGVACGAVSGAEGEGGRGGRAEGRIAALPAPSRPRWALCMFPAAPRPQPYAPRVHVTARFGQSAPPMLPAPPLHLSNTPPTHPHPTPPTAAADRRAPDGASAPLYRAAGAPPLRTRHERTDGRTDRHGPAVNRQTHRRRSDRPTDRTRLALAPTDWQTDKPTYGQTETAHSTLTDRRTDCTRPTAHQQTDGQTDRQTALDPQYTNRQIGRLMDRLHQAGTAPTEQPTRARCRAPMDRRTHRSPARAGAADTDAVG
ncbi:uncharacterized protein LOC135187767 [Pogoniulus pusillus]|uniref:uncharacterized protein LOC135187767 n=1 Tax=Pogoniulus pusillus TaxID=488313 RepID=UPI0030B9A2FF